MIIYQIRYLCGGSSPKCLHKQCERIWKTLVLCWRKAMCHRLSRGIITIAMTPSPSLRGLISLFDLNKAIKSKRVDIEISCRDGCFVSQHEQTTNTFNHSGSTWTVGSSSTESRSPEKLVGKVDRSTSKLEAVFRTFCHSSTFWIVSKKSLDISVVLCSEESSDSSSESSYMLILDLRRSSSFRDRSIMLSCGVTIVSSWNNWYTGFSFSNILPSTNLM